MREQLFEPYQTTKQGMGVGMYESSQLSGISEHTLELADGELVPGVPPVAVFAVSPPEADGGMSDAKHKPMLS